MQRTACGVFKILSSNVRNPQNICIKQNLKIWVKYIKLPFQKDKNMGIMREKYFLSYFYMKFNYLKYISA